jgi:uncharacterized protein with HEPN domain
MKRDKAAYLHDLLEACAHIESFTANHSCAEYRSDILTKRAVEREFDTLVLFYGDRKMYIISGSHN